MTDISGCLDNHLKLFCNFGASRLQSVGLVHLKYFSVKQEIWNWPAYIGSLSVSSIYHDSLFKLSHLSQWPKQYSTERIFLFTRDYGHFRSGVTVAVQQSWTLQILSLCSASPSSATNTLIHSGSTGTLLLFKLLFIPPSLIYRVLFSPYQAPFLFILQQLRKPSYLKKKLI